MTDDIRQAAERYLAEFKCSEPTSTTWVTDLVEDAIRRDREERGNKTTELRRWVDDLQSGMYINCVYCGHRYGPKENTPMSMADVLKEHIERCPKHPMSKLKQENERLVSDDLSAKLIRLAKKTEDPELYCRGDSWECWIEAKKPQRYGTPLEAVDAALAELEKK